jgi:hypothetical protein
MGLNLTEKTEYDYKKEVILTTAFLDLYSPKMVRIEYVSKCKLPANPVKSRRIKGFRDYDKSTFCLLGQDFQLSRKALYLEDSKEFRKMIYTPFTPFEGEHPTEGVKK